MQKEWKLGTALLAAAIFAVSSACNPPQPHVEKKQEDMYQHTYAPKKPTLVADTVYVPIYSQIYSESKGADFLLTATLSIRNTSMRDTMLLHDIDYYDTHGTLVKQFISQSILLGPLETAEFVIDREDDTGGSGANFIVTWGSDSRDITPMFQGVMISTNGQQGVAFTTEGVSIAKQ